MNNQKFSEYLNECGFYFSNIVNPNKTLFGAEVKDKKPAKKKKKGELEPNPLNNEKLTNYFQIVNAIQ